LITPVAFDIPQILPFQTLATLPHEMSTLHATLTPSPVLASRRASAAGDTWTS
jgi:hypothetical protein